jgi:hypothetical protein
VAFAAFLELIRGGKAGGASADHSDGAVASVLDWGVMIVGGWRHDSPERINGRVTIVSVLMVKGKLSSALFSFRLVRYWPFDDRGLRLAILRRADDGRH